MTRNEKVVALFRLGLAYSHIAKRMKMSRSAVGGVLYRAGERHKIEERLRRQAEGRAQAWADRRRSKKK